jgi:hypothetical protein
MKKFSTRLIFLLFLLFLFAPSVFASVKNTERFFVESSYDIEKRRVVDAKLELITNYIYFYFDEKWWESLDEEKKREYERTIYSLGNEFENKIYPEIAKIFGEAPKHDVVGHEKRIFVFFHPMNKNSGGYFRTGDQYSIYQYPRSNEKNILYLNTDLIEEKTLSGYLAHEYIHLVTFNEKSIKFNVNEEVWLNELRAEAIITILGYNKDYENSNLKKRIENFLRDPDISLTEWTDQAADYGVINLFAQYLLDHYGKEILTDSLKTELVGIPSIDYALAKNKIDKRFSQIFTEWKIAVYLNDCSYGEYYCFKEEKLKDFRVEPTTFFITTKNNGFHEISYQTKNWAGNWFRFVGGTGTLHLRFSGENFIAYYVLCKKDDYCDIDRLKTNKEGEGSMIIKDFNSTYDSITIISSLQKRFTGFNGAEKTTSFNIDVEIKEEVSEEVSLEERREKVLLLLEMIKEIYNFLGREVPKRTNIIENNLYYGTTNSKEVQLLQKFLKDQGKTIYPEGLVTGNFYDLTKNAVIRFQEAHYEKILQPLGLSQGTGYVGEKTREVINSFLRKR